MARWRLSSISFVISFADDHIQMDIEINYFMSNTPQVLFMMSNYNKDKNNVVIHL